MIAYLQRGPQYFTLEELKAYDGSDPEKPIYLSINGTVYDVSKGSAMYGPGGSYHFFAGADASRAFVTACFQDDITPDMRGVEEMYLPVDDAEVDAYWTPEQMEIVREKELERAQAKVYSGLKHWVDFFAKSKKYHKVGYLQLEEGWLEKQPQRQLCDAAQKGRKVRRHPVKKSD